jgi:hypothetical protein
MFQLHTIQFIGQEILVMISWWWWAAPIETQKKQKKKPIIGKTQFHWFEQEQDPIFSNI